MMAVDETLMMALKIQANQIVQHDKIIELKSRILNAHDYLSDINFER